MLYVLVILAVLTERCESGRPMARNALLVSSSEPISAPVASTEQVLQKNPNVIVQFATSIKDSCVKTVDGLGQLRKNHGKCNEIRKRQNQYREQVAQQWDLEGKYKSETKGQIKRRLAELQGGISFADFVFLQKGKEDRGKVLNIAFLMWAGPRFLPYALMFNPQMLPSTFANDFSNPGESAFRRLARERTLSVVQALSELEKQAICGVGGGFFSSLNIFGKGKQLERQKQLGQVLDSARRNLQGQLDTPTNMLQQIDGFLYRKTVFTKAEERLVQVPKCLVQGLGRVVTGGSTGLLSSLQPHFMQRGALNGHFRKLEMTDSFLVETKVDLATIPRHLLQEACADRGTCNPDATVEEMSANLATWLNFAVIEPAARVKQQGGFYNSNLGRMALLSFNACKSTRELTPPTLSQLVLEPSGP